MVPDIRKGLKRYSESFRQARELALNEADTSLRLTKFFEDVLEFDALKDISKEANFKNKYVDICLKIDGVTKLLVEAKAAGVKLRDRHIEQAQSYASQNNFRWVVLTNGVEWNLYHLTFDEGIEYELAFSISLAEDLDLEDAAAKLALLHKKAIKAGDLEEYWEQATALGPESIGKALFSEPVVALLRREIRRQTDLLIDPEDLVKAVHSMMSQESRELIGPPRIRKRRRAAKKSLTTEAPSSGQKTPSQPVEK
jgi:Type I restriction enzyme R protein N terminus (HSDR_N)